MSKYTIEVKLQEFESLAHFEKELEEYLKYYNRKRIKAKLKDPNSDIRSSLKYLSNFIRSVHLGVGTFMNLFWLLFLI